MAKAATKSAPRKQGANPDCTDSGKRLPWWRRLINVCAVVANIVIAIGLITCGFIGKVDPNTFAPSVMMVMIFPAWIVAAVLIFILDLFFWRRTAMIIGSAMIVCGTPIHDYCPLNWPKGKMSEAQAERAFKVLTYNVYTGFDHTRVFDFDTNPQVGHILDSNADVVLVQEAFDLSPSVYIRTTKQQIDALHSKYPYIYVHNTLMILSRYPAEALPLDFEFKALGDGDMAAWRLHIGERVVNVFNLHLRSLLLHDHEKSIYANVINIDSISRSEIHQFRAEVVSKINEAARVRADQVHELQRYIRKYGGHDVLICGDFNDPIGCYAIHELTAHDHFINAYPKVGFGPGLTYNANSLPFRIDHILYRGDFTPYSARIGSLRQSDHYPLEITFLLD